MNKYQEALNALLSFRVCESTHNRRLLENNPHAASILKELVDKATPKKPIKKVAVIEYENEETVERPYFVCGCENYSQVNRNDRYCPKCGQAIDWSEDE